MPRAKQDVDGVNDGPIKPRSGAARLECSATKSGSSTLIYSPLQDAFVLRYRTLSSYLRTVLKQARQKDKKVKERSKGNTNKDKANKNDKDPSQR